MSYDIFNKDGSHITATDTIEQARELIQDTNNYIQYSPKAIKRVNAELVARFPKPVTNETEDQALLRMAHEQIKPFTNTCYNRKYGCGELLS